MGISDLGDAARAELAGYRTRAIRRRENWLQDLYVDIGLTVLARAHAAIHEGQLVTKTQAISRLTNLGVPAEVVDGVAHRRRGQTVDLSDDERRDRAIIVRRFLAREIARMLAPPAP